MILLISDTPVAGTVNRIAHWLNRLSGQKCYALTKRNYPHNAFRLNGGAFGGLPEWEKFVVQCVREAKSIFIHNIVDDKLLDLIFASKNANTSIYYQIHSPPLEPPLFDYQVISDYSFNAVLAVAQGYGRFIKNSIVVPNIIADFDLPCIFDKSPLVFSPHMRSTNFRWSAKFTDKCKKSLLANEHQFGRYRVSQNIDKLFGREVITHEEMLLYLQAVSLVIDDINTGLFHQTALEGLKASCAVFSAADLESIEQFCVAADVEAPPFVYVNGIEDVISLLVDNSFRKSVPAIMAASKEYGRLYLSEERLAQCYWARIKSLVN
jgi:hypothetical protein